MRLFRALLHLYPAAFRNEYGEELCAIFAQRRRDASGSLAALALWVETIFDTIANAVPVHWDILRQDVRYAARTLGRSPGFTLTAILVAALGIGANTAAFSITDHVLLRPLPFADSARLVMLWENLFPNFYSQMEPSPPNYRDWKRMSTSFEAMTAYRGLSVNLIGQEDPERLEGSAVTADLFPMIGAQPALGRVFNASDDRAGAPGTLLLSHGLWKQVFGGDPGVLGRKVILDNEPYEIIGVMPREFHFPSRLIQLWTPMRFAESDFEDRTNNYLKVVAKLRRGVSLEQAGAEIRLIAAQLERTYPKENKQVGAGVFRLRDEVSQRSRLLLMAQLGAAFCVLLIAYTNLANLLLTRSIVRRKELAVRTALGAGRERLVRQMLTESLMLALAGGLLGVLIALTALPLLAKLVPNSLPIADLPSIDWRVLTFAGLLTGLTGIAFGAVPALRVCRDAGANGLREGSRAGVGGRRERLRSLLVIAEVTGSVVLLVSSGLLIRALWRLEAIDPGFRSGGVLTLRTSLPMPKYEKDARREQFYTQVLSGVRQLPGVSAAAYISFLPIAHPGGIWAVTVEGCPPELENVRQVSLRFVTPGFFATLGIPLHLGRDVSESDTLTSPFVAVVSESFARKYWPNENPLGRRFQFAFATRMVTGVVGDIRVRGLERTSEPQVYLPYKQVPDGWLIWYAPKDLAVRTASDPARLLPSIRRIVQGADPEQPVSDVRTLSDIVEGDTAPRRVQIRVLGAFAAVAFLLAAIGIHGLLSFTVSNRRQEIGVRIALGAQSSDIVTMVLREIVPLSAAGLISGVALAYAVGRTMEALLAGVRPDDAPAFLSAVALTLMMTVIGSLWPTLRAIHVDPTTAIRAE